MLGGIALHKAQMEVFNDTSRFRVVAAGRRLGKCLGPDSLIAMSDGTYRPICEVKSGDYAVTLNEDTFRLEHKPVKHVLSNGVKPTVVVKTSKRSLRCTPNHPLLVNGKWTKAEDIRLGDLIAVPKALPVFGDQPQDQDRIDLLSIWLAEGAKNIISNTTPEIINIIKGSVKRLFDLTIVDWKGLGVDWRITDGKGYTYRTGKDRNKFLAWLREENLVECNSKTKFIPNWVYQLPKEQLARFLNLFVACDGCITKKGKSGWSMEIGLANERLVMQLSDLFLKFGIRGQIHKKVHKKLNRHGEPFVSWTYLVMDARCIKIFAEEIGALSKEKNVGLALEYANQCSSSCNTYIPVSYEDYMPMLKYEPEKDFKLSYNSVVPNDMPSELKSILNSWRKQTPERISEKRYDQLRPYSDGFYDPLIDNDIVWEEVSAVNDAGEIETWDLSLEDNHNFFANGICTHNTILLKAELLRAASTSKQLVWYVAPTYKQAKQIMWTDLIETIPHEYIKKKNETTLDITLINGSRICLRGSDKPESLRGVGLNFLGMDEMQDIRPEVWKTVLRPTLASTRGKAIFVGSPKTRNILFELFELGQNEELRNKKVWRSWQFPTIMSPFIPASEIEAARADMDERSFNMEFNANFMDVSGRVYHPFDRTTHMGHYPFNPKLPIWIGQDFNIDPMSSVVIQPQPNGEVWVVDEIFLHNSNTVAVCDEIEKRLFRYTNQVRIYPDPAGASRSSGRGESDLDIFRERGFKRIKYRKKHPAVADRVNAVNKMLRAADGTIKLKVDNKCKNLMRSLEGTLYKKNSYEVDKALNLEHIADALGYCIEIEFPRRTFVPMGLSV